VKRGELAAENELLGGSTGKLDQFIRDINYAYMFGEDISGENLICLYQVLNQQQ
jgi:hypothetical protein